MSAGMLLSALFDGLIDDVPDCHVSDMTSDSRQVVPGGLFIACRGVQQHGLEYLPEALAAGAVAVAWEPEPGLTAPDVPQSVVVFPVDRLGEQLGMIADRFFVAPSSAISVAGITGTNGKTTTAWLLAQAMQHLGVTSAYMGTLGFGLMSAGIAPTALTTPGVISVHRRLRSMTDTGAQFVAMEVSSHGLDQGRADGVRFSTVAFTNLTREHLDYHVTMAAYAGAKQRLFTEFECNSAVINVANDFGKELADLLHKDVHLLTVSTDASVPASLHAELLAIGADGLRVRFFDKHGEAELQSSLWGRFNVENLLVAAGILMVSGIALNDAISALAKCDAPAGRMELLGGEASQPLVIIDFAHTPDALDKALTTVRDHCTGTIWCVFGCGGDRDQGKRSEMAEVVSRRADFAIVTDDNPRHESPEKIVADILQGFSADTRAEVVHDRAAAIGKAVASAAQGDVVFIAGKGAESYQLEGDRAHPFSDRDVASRALEAAA